MSDPAVQRSAVDPLAGWMPARAEGLLATFSAGGVLHAADVHVARRLGQLGGETREDVLLAASLAVRAVRHGSVRFSLDDVAASVVAEDAGAEGSVIAELPWPQPDSWLELLRTSPLVREHGGLGPDGNAPGGDNGGDNGGETGGQTGGSGPDTAAAATADVRPLQLWGRDVWLERYWRIEAAVADDLLRRSAAPPAVDEDRLSAVLSELWPVPKSGPDPDEDQRTAAGTALRSPVSILGGGPGTGKTTTVARILVALQAMTAGIGAAGIGAPSIALAAPTGKAAARLQEAIGAAANDPALPAEGRLLLAGLSTSTVHRLISAYRSSGRSRYHAENPLPHDVVVVDEASMLALGLFHRLLAALRPATRLLLVGDPEQLTSVEAGAVLADLSAVHPTSSFAPGVSRLRLNRRSGDQPELTALATGLRTGDVDAVLQVIAGGGQAISWYEVADDQPLPAPVEAVLSAQLLGVDRDLLAAGRAGDAEAAIGALERHRLLCAHRRGPRGVRYWTAQARRWLSEIEGGLPYAYDERYAGQPLLVTENDYENQLWNGDTGVVLARGDDLVAAFGRGSTPFELPVGRVGHATPLHAMTVHRSQGSEFDEVTVLLPSAASALATRELLYTAVTRARRRVTLIGSSAAIRACVARPAQRATGLRRRLEA